jgi:hypothetical protein
MNWWTDIFHNGKNALRYLIPNLAVIAVLDPHDAAIVPSVEFGRIWLSAGELRKDHTAMLHANRVNLACFIKRQQGNVKRQR